MAEKTVKTSIEIPLRVPFSVDGAEMKKITMRRPTVGDRVKAQDRASGNAEFGERLLFADLCNLAGGDPDVFLAMDLADYETLKAKFNDFFL